MTTEIPGWMTDRDLEILEYLASCVPDNGNILEIGPFLGRSTSALLKGKKDNVTLDVVDTFRGIEFDQYHHDLKGSRDIYDQMNDLAKATGDWEEAFKFCNKENIEKMNIFKCSSKEFELKKSYDFSFIDGDHIFENVFFDIKKFINTNGIIAGDDFVPKWPDVAKAVNVFQARRYATLVVPRASKIWILVPFGNYWRNCIKEII